jgi:hypothetical protein
MPPRHVIPAGREVSAEHSTNPDSAKPRSLDSLTAPTRDIDSATANASRATHSALPEAPRVRMVYIVTTASPIGGA